MFVIEAGGLNAIKTYGESVTDARFWEYKGSLPRATTTTIVYTSGSTGTRRVFRTDPPCFAFTVLSLQVHASCRRAWPNRRLLLFLPLSHVFR